MVDFHTHILPDIDDGSPDVKTSIEMLKMLKSQGIDKVLLTPHFYMEKDDAGRFLARREKAVCELVSAVKSEENIPRLIVGAEVLLYPEVDQMENIKDFCITGTNYMLVEMPFFEWSTMTYETLGKLCEKGIIPIIAHFERYEGILYDKGRIYRIMDMGCIIQSNASFFNSPLSRRNALKFLDKGLIHLIGSDCHNLKSRKPDIGRAYNIISKRLGQSGMETLNGVAELVLSNADYCI